MSISSDHINNYFIYKEVIYVLHVHHLHTFATKPMFKWYSPVDIFLLTWLIRRLYRVYVITTQYYNKYAIITSAIHFSLSNRLIDRKFLKPVKNDNWLH